MSHFEYDSSIEGRTNKYESSFFHIYLQGESPITLGGLKDVSERDYASFVHEYIHYIQQLTTPYGIKYNRFFVYKLMFFREAVSSSDTIVTPVLMEEIQAAKDFELELSRKNGCKSFSKGTVSDIEIINSDIALAKTNDTAVNIVVYDFENDRIFEDGFKFGYICVMESMAHLIQSLINPELPHNEVRYQAAHLICDKIRPDIKDDTKLLISICYTALFFDNPGHAFFEILQSAAKDEDGVELFQRYMRDYSRTFNEEEMPNYRMMHALMDDFIKYLEVLLGNEAPYMRFVIKNCKYESSNGNSVLLNFLYGKNLGEIEELNELIDWYGIPAIDSKNDNIVIPFDPHTNKPYTETAALLSLELIYARLTDVDSDQKCIRLPICDRISREKEIDLIDENCVETQWSKQLSCLFKEGLSYWRMSEKTVV